MPVAIIKSFFYEWEEPELPELTKRPSTVLEVFLEQDLSEVHIPESELKVFADVYEEGWLTGDLWRVSHITLDNETSGNVHHVSIEPIHPVTPNLKTASKNPSGYLQGHKHHIVYLYMRGRSTLLDDYLDPVGDSELIPEMEINGYNKEGLASNIFIRNGYVLKVDSVITDRQEVIYIYTIKSDYYTYKPNMNILKMTVKPITAPLLIIVVHPEVKPFSSSYKIFLMQDSEDTKSFSSSYKIFIIQDNEATWSLSIPNYIDEEAEKLSGSISSEVDSITHIAEG